MIKRKILLFLACLCLLGLPARSFAQEAAIKNQSLQDAMDKELRETEKSSQAAAEKLVSAIEIKGNKSISTNTVLSKMKTRIGYPFNENIISEDIKRLYKLGYFSDIKLDSESYKGGIKVVIAVTERPIVEKVTFSGITRLTMKEENIKESLKTKEGQYLDYPDLKDDLVTLRKLYEKRGYGETEIEHKVNISPETNKARVEFAVREGKKFRIKNIVVKGNAAFPAKRILKIMKTKRAWFFNAGALKEDVFKEDMERVKSFYRRQGYSEASVDNKVEKDPRKPFLYITVEIREGKKYLVGSVSVKGNKEISEKDILEKLLECIPGKVFSQEGLKQDLANIHYLYFGRGYVSAQVQETTSLNAATGRVDISYSINENDLSYVNRVKIKGNIKTKDLVIRRELRISPGDRFDGDKLSRSKERLNNLGYFDEISYDTQDTEDPARKDLIVEVKEAKTGSFSFGGGYSTIDDFVGFVELEQKNFDWKNFPYFTGAGQDLRLRGSVGTVSGGFELSFTEPWMFDYPVSFGFDAYKRTHKREEDIGYGYDEDITGGDIRLGKEITEYVSANMRYRFDTIDISNIPDTATVDLKDENGKNSISSMELGLTFDSRDNRFDPHRGNLLSGLIQEAGGPFGADKNFWKFYGRASHYFPAWRNSVFELRARVGLTEPYSDSEKVPIYERFFAGGAETIRGYRERKVGPFDAVTKDPLGGEAMLLGNVEYIYPALEFLKIAAFYDTGNVWAKSNKIGSGGFKSGFGLGLRVKTPIGPIRLDYGIPLNKESGEDSKGNGRIHFSVSHGF